MPKQAVNLTEPAWPVCRAAVRMRGAIQLDSSGTRGTGVRDIDSDYFRIRSNEVASPSSPPFWEAYVARAASGIDAPIVRISLKVGLGPGRTALEFNASAGGAGWSTSADSATRMVDTSAELHSNQTDRPLTFRSRMVYDPLPALAPAPELVRRLAEEVSGVTRPFAGEWKYVGMEDACLAARLPSPNERYAATTWNEVLTAIRTRLPEGYIVFIGDMSWERGDHSAVELVLAPGNGWQDILRAAATEPINHGLTTEAVVRQLAEYDAQFGIELVQASLSSVTFLLREPAALPATLAEDLIDFCPDLEDVSSEEELAQDIERGVINLWWD